MIPITLYDYHLFSSWLLPIDWPCLALFPSIDCWELVEITTHTHADKRVCGGLKKIGVPNIYYFVSIPPNSAAFPPATFPLAVTNTIWRRRRRRSTLIIMVIKLVDNTHTRTPLRVISCFFFSFLFFCSARDSVLPWRSCINYLSPCAADMLLLTNA